MHDPAKDRTGDGCQCYLPCLRRRARNFFLRLRYLCLFIFFLLFFRTLLQLATGSEMPGSQRNGRGSKWLVCHVNPGYEGNGGLLYDVGWAHVRHHRDLYLAGKSGMGGGAILLSYPPVDALRSKCPYCHFGDLFSSCCCNLDPSTYSRLHLSKNRDITATPREGYCHAR